MTAVAKLKDACSFKESYDRPRQQRHPSVGKGPYSQSYGSSSEVWMWETIKKAMHWRIDAFELWCWRRLLRVSWTARRSNSQPLGNQPWIFIGRTDAEAPILWSPVAKSWLIGKDPDVGNDWGQEEKGMTEDEMTSPTQWTMSLNKFWEIVKDREAWHALVHRVAKSQTRLSNWTITSSLSISRITKLHNYKIVTINE